GGSFIDVAPRKHPRHDSAVRESLVRRAAGNVLEEELRKYPRGVTVGALLKATVAPVADVERLHARRLGDWIFSDDAWQSIAAGGSITVAQLRDRMGASRRPVLALLEYLDAQRVTRRVGDSRVLR